MGRGVPSPSRLRVWENVVSCRVTAENDFTKFNGRKIDLVICILMNFMTSDVLAEISDG